MSMVQVERELEELKGVHAVYEQCCRRYDRAVQSSAVIQGVGVFVLTAWALGVPWVAWPFRVVLVFCWSALVLFGVFHTRGRYRASMEVLRIREQQVEALTQARLVEAARRGADGNAERAGDGG